MGDTKPQVAAFTELDSGTLYALLKLRVDVFVVEQECPYPELDGRDTEPGTRHVWLSRDSGAPEAYLRVLDDPDGARIGRVVTAPQARGAGLGARLMEAALEVIGDRTVRLDAQTQVSGFYARYGFVVDGPEYIEDGIPHVPMVRLTAGR
ncbi:GNAT family N-acetyltransferase [Actinoallomurus sp. CA-150999]|uniref:GNAT family N-acetyltransferase n=1 Tax=Actinoallomurus sp. CA-150999 TaxID=3239887 RepID=UPI003D89F7C9